MTIFDYRKGLSELLAATIIVDCAQLLAQRRNQSLPSSQVPIEMSFGEAASFRANQVIAVECGRACMPHSLIGGAIGDEARPVDQLVTRLGRFVQGTLRHEPGPRTVRFGRLHCTWK